MASPSGTDGRSAAQRKRHEPRLCRRVSQGLHHPRWVHFCEIEWSVLLDSLAPAVREINAFARTLGKPVTFPIEVRCAGADDIALLNANATDPGYIAAHDFWGTPYNDYFSGLWLIVRDLDG